MKYLLYKTNGLLRKFPLIKPIIKIGRAKHNDLVIDNDFISREHLNIKVRPGSIIIEDAGSENGFFIDKKKKKKAEINVGDSFKAGEIEFAFQEGDPEDFTLAKDIQSVSFTHNEDSSHNQIEYSKTKSVQTIFKRIDKEILKAGPKFSSFNDFTSFLSQKLSEIPNFGALFLVTRGESLNIQFSVNGETGALENLKEINSIFDKKFAAAKEELNRGKFLYFPLELGDTQSALIYFPTGDERFEARNIEKFLVSLCKEVELIYTFIEEKRSRVKEKSDQVEAEVEIVTNSREMKYLIEQAKKIAGSDVFILIQGESGTGKELFARLIHCYSKRKEKNFVALNCAAIPDNLLESELFGYEKGAFTGAYSRKKGKLELASGGTLILDEIGDMPINLQTKLLRALEEHEFYPLGSTNSIKVDLRIISLTHQNLEQLINEKKFREDLYYRLVHRIITIPPLRERREDIPPLINYFTGTFCKQRKRTIKGYTVKAFDALVNYHWKGNVRQLENEINSIVNLTDDGATIDFDILSDKIKENYNAKPVKDKPTQTKPEYNKKPDREIIVRILEKYGWNKSKAALELNMTYHGLHKKMKKMGIVKRA